jgi:hypothetical protein
MAEKIKLFELDIDSNNLLKSLADTRKEIEALNAAQKANKRETEEERKAFEANAVILKQLSSEYRNNQKVLDALTKAQTQTIDTVDDARKALSAVSVLWAQVTRVEGENSEQAQELAKRKLELTNRLKELEGATGDTRRNVGNYTASLKEALQQTGGLAKGALGLFDTLKANPFILLVDLLVKLGSAISKNQGIVDAFTKVWTPLKQVLDFIVGLIGDQVLVVFNKLSGLFTDFEGTVKSLGKAIVENITNRFKAFKVLAEGVGQLLRGDVKDAIKTFTNGVVQLTTGVTDATDKLTQLGEKAKGAFEVGKQVDALRKEITRLTEAAEEADSATNARIQNLRLQAEDANKTEAQRLKALKEAIALENGLADNRVAIARKQLDLVKLENSTSTTSNENKLKIREAEAAINDILAQRDTRLKELTAAEKARSQAIQNQVKAEGEARKKAAQEELDLAAKQAEERVKVFELANKTRIKDDTILTDELVKSEVERYAKLIELQADFIKKSGEARGQSEAEVQLLIDGLNTQFDDFVTGISAKSAEQGIKALTDAIAVARKNLQEGQREQGVLLTQEQIDAEKKLLSDLEAAEVAALDARLKANLTSQAEYELELFNIKKKFRDQAAALDLSGETEAAQREAFNFQTRIAILQAQGANELQIRQEQLERQKEIEIAAAKAIGASVSDVEEKYRLLNEQLERDSVNTRLEMAASYLSQLSNLLGENTLFGKLTASAAAATNTFISAQEAFRSQLIPAEPSSLPRAIVAAAFATATGLKTIANINKVKVPEAKKPTIPKLEQGGFVIGGNRHSAGGTLFQGSDGSAFEAERDEALFVLNRNATSKLKALSSLNRMFPMTKRIGAFQSGGFPQQSAQELSNRLSAGDLLAGIQQQQIVVDVKDIISETGRRVQLVDQATL